MSKEKIRSPLSFTGNEHRKMGSTPAWNFLADPDKPRVFFMSDDDIKSYLELQKTVMSEAYTEDASLSDVLNRLRLETRDNYEATLRYLSKIGRLPNGYIKELESLS